MMPIILPKKAPDQSHAAVLARYASNTQGKENRVKDLWGVKLPEEPDLAALEIEAVQRNNHQARSDTLYHMIISFHYADLEKLTPDILRTIEVDVAKVLGFNEHQRYVAFHTDTSHPHLHFIANRINPVTFKAVSPYNDFKKVAELCAAYEQTLNLVKDSHEVKRSKAERLARNIEARSGLESFSSYVLRECGEELKAAKTWKEFHRSLSKISATIRPRGAGLVIVDSEDREYKASSIHAEFSKKHLESRFGEFEAYEYREAIKRPWKNFRQPTGFKKDVTDLYLKYIDARLEREKEIAEIKAIENEREEQLAYIEVRRKNFLDACLKAHMNRKDALEKVELFQTAATEVREETKERKRAFYRNHKGYGFLDWLKKQAEAGDVEALQALRARQKDDSEHSKTFGDFFNGVVIAVVVSSDMLIDFVTKQGVIVYRAGEGTVADDGHLLRVSGKVKGQGIVSALKLAQMQYGKTLDVNGSEMFRERVLNAVVQENLDVRFTNKEMERKRGKMMKSRSRETRPIAR